MVPNLSKQEALKMKKKQVLNYYGFKNIKDFCNRNSHMVKHGRAPSRKAIIKALVA